MRKLKLIGVKEERGELPGDFQPVGEVYVENGKVKVESPYPDLAKELLTEIERGAYTEGFLISPSREDPGTRHKADDPQFLEALRYADGMWDKRFGGWRIFEVRSQVVDE